MGSLCGKDEPAIEIKLKLKSNCCNRREDSHNKNNNNEKDSHDNITKNKYVKQTIEIKAPEKIPVRCKSGI